MQFHVASSGSAEVVEGCGPSQKLLHRRVPTRVIEISQQSDLVRMVDESLDTEGYRLSRRFVASHDEQQEHGVDLAALEWLASQGCSRVLRPPIPLAAFPATRR